MMLDTCNFRARPFRDENPWSTATLKQALHMPARISSFFDVVFLTALSVHAGSADVNLQIVLQAYA